MKKMKREPQHTLTVSSILWKFAKENPGTTAVYIALLALIPLQDIGLPHIYGKVVNAIQAKKPLLTPFFIVIGVIIIIQIGILISEWNETHHTYPQLLALIRREILAYVFKEHETDYDEQMTAVLLAKMIKLPTVLYNLVDQYKIVLIPQVIVCIAMITYFAMHDLVLAATIFVAVVIIVMVVNMSPSMCSNHSIRREKVMNEMHEGVDDVLRNMMAVYNADSMSIEDTIMSNIHSSYVRESRDTIGCVMNTKLAILPIIIFVFGFFMWRSYTLLGRGRMNTGKFVSLFLIMMSLLGSMSRYVGQVKELVSRRGMIEASLQELATKIPNIDENDNHIIKTPPTDGEIVVSNLNYTYPGSTMPILRGINLVVPRGQRLLIVGRIGCGKTTLLRLLMKYKIVSHATGGKGELWLQGKPYSTLTAQEVRATVGYVPQVPILFNRTIYENIVYPQGSSVSSSPLTRHALSKQEVMELMASLNLEHIFDTFPEGLDANVGKSGSRLSGGQRQIVWILRVLLQNPSILLMDEPTASIDEKTKDVVRNLLSRVMHGRTVIMVTHDSYLERFADRIVELEEGRVVRDEVVGMRHHSFL